MKTTAHYDVIILGGGMAGMTAAIYCARANRSCIILEKDITGGLANSTYIVENYPSYTEVHGMELMQKVRDQVDQLDVPVEEICEIEFLSLTEQPKRIETAEAIYEGKSVILATGRKPIPLDVPTECAQVHHCAICDGSAYKGKHVLVVGGGNSAFDESLYMMQLGIAKITLVEVMDRFFAVQTAQDALLAYNGVEAFTDTFVKDLDTVNDSLQAVILENKNTGETKKIAVDGIFVFLGQKPNSTMFADVIKLDKSGYIVADENMQTNVPGVFSAGDINAKQFRQLTTAAADGTIAALMADRYLRTL